MGDFVTNYILDSLNPPPKKTSTIAPFTNTATSHAIKIKVNGMMIGRIQSWSPSQSRAVQPVYEINSVTQGDVAENIPGVVSGLTIQVTRFDLYNLRMEQAWGEGFDLREMICNQANPLSITEHWIKPSGEYSSYVYSGCWFSNMGRQISVQGDRIINVSATLQYERKRRFI